ncbi:dynein beta chain, ciliary-like isoform X2 [Bombyx mandarina]|uniref:Dynein beta chain, ciliary-like isoform X2 n=1 Tax=Bombyx mandarina TaxID=7092 RepID=A0A6J2JWM3_BOMMA|nr:dynein beta chain, ciliary-like isoform X2 [Bombyx mandarina]
MGDKEDVDTRLEFMSEYLLKTLKQKADKWAKFITGDERHILFRYFDMPKYDIIVFRMNTAGMLTCSTSFPPISRGKMVYFLRNVDDKITQANFRKAVTIGEMSGNVLMDLSVLADEVIGPMLCNPENQKGWPKIVQNDMKRHVNDLRNLMHQLKGEMSSQVMLPMPAGVENIYHAETRLKESDGEDVDLYLKTNIEGAVIKWAQQVHDLLKEDSYMAFKRTRFPLPTADIEFYSTRLRNLEGIYSQLRDPRVKRMANYLEETQSVYLNCFKSMLTNVVAAIVECRDIYVYQKPLIMHFETFEGTDFADAKSLIRPMFHCICLLWGNSRYYCNIEKLIPLLREVCNLVIQQCTNSIDPTAIFQGDAEEQLLKIRKAMSILNHFIETYEVNRDKVHTFFPGGVMPVRWSFDFDRVFMRFNVYMKRLKMIENILESTVEILKLEKVEFCGLRGKILSTECMKVLEEYTIIYQNLGNMTYDPADPEDEKFLADYEKHMAVLEDVDRRLASLFSQGLDECHNLEHFFKFFQIIGDLFHRPIIKKELKPKLTKLLDFMHSNLDAVKEIFDEEMAKMTKGPERPMVDAYLPPIGGMLWWIHKLRRRIQAPMEDFILFEDPIIETESALYMKQKHNEMLGYLNVLEDRQFKQWCATVPPICKTHLAKNLIYRDPPFVRNNFSPELVMLLREIKYMKYLDKQGIPPDGLELYGRNEKLQYDMNRLNRAIAWYNAIREGSHETEVALIEKEISAIDELLGRGVEELTWNDDFADWIAEVYAAINTLQERVLTAQNNVKRGLANIAEWGDKPLHNRKVNPDKLELLAVNERHHRFSKRRSQIIASHDEFQTILKDNYKLFFNIQEEEESEDEEEELEEVDESTIDEDEKAARAAKLAEIMQRREEKRLVREEREMEKAEAARIKFVRREARRLKAEEKAAEKAERQSRRDAGEEVESPAEEEEEIVDPEELADIEAERIEMEEEAFRAERWPAYVEYVDSLVSKQIMKAIQSSLDLFEKQTDLEKGPRVAFLEIIAELRDPDIFFSPSLDIDDEDGLYDTLREMMKDMFLQATLFERIDPIVPLATYEDDIAREEAMIDLYHEILKRVENSINDIVQYATRYEKYTPLWMEDRQETLAAFMKYGRVIPPEEFDKYRFENCCDPPESKPSLEQYQKEIDKYNLMYDEVAALPGDYLCNGWLKLNLKRLNQAIMNIICKWSNLYKQNLKDHVQTSLDDLEKFINYASKELSVELGDDDYEGLLKVMRVLNEVRAKVDAGTEQMFDPLRDIIDVLKEYGVDFPEETYEQLDVLPERWRNLVKLATVMKNNVAPLQAAQAALIAKRVALINLRLTMYREQFKLKEMFLEACKEPYRQIDKVHQELLNFEEIVDGLKRSCTLFDIQPPDEKNLKQCRREIKLIKQLWDYYSLVMGTIEFWKKSPWKKIDADGMDQECKRFTKDLRQLDKEMRVWEPYLVIEGIIKNLLTSLRAVTDLQNPAIKDRHWIELMMATKVKFHIDDDTTLADLLALSLHKYEEEVKTIVDKSVKEAAMEKTLRELEATWAIMEFDYTTHDRTGTKLPKASEELVETLEDNQNQVQNMMSSKFIGFYETEVTVWQKKLGTADAVIALWFEVQRKWQYLESIFVGSDDIRSQLPEDSKRFDGIDKTFKELLKDIGVTPNVVQATNKPGLLDKLEDLMKALNLCEKALNDYLETKRLAYPRFYFVSSADLLDILSNGNNPPAVCRHLTKLYDNLAKLVFPKPGSKQAYEMISKENEEHVPFKAPCCDCSGKVELWLNRVTDCMRYTLRDIFEHCVKSYEDKSRDEWVFDWPAQPALVGTQIWWTTETNQAFAKLEEGYENALKDYQKKQIAQLNALIVLLLSDLTVGDRQKIMTICTIDVHSRDVVAKLIVAKVETSNAFQWQSQLRHRWDSNLNNCFANICDAQFLYDYEYLGNTPRLVITPLTDRCYITLTQSLHLIMGGAPAGPAGTGKTETTKDLGRALGIMVYVFNCSEQMDYKSCGNIYKGLAQTGAWGCFDEFNRISVEVLSVVSVQVKSVLDAIKAKKKKFDFMGEYITLISTVGMFITMNPGYAGRTELPENLKALFRPCAMVVPDFELICEIMLVAEGFQEARLLARKFITLYMLCRELLSKQDHYDWGLRAIKSVLVVAGSLKRSDRQRPEDQVLMRALRDFNIPKIVTDDTPVFMGLIGDLFPALDVPRKRDMDFEKSLIEGALSMKLQPEPGFILKMVQLVELFAVRHSVFIIGFAGTGKSMVWQCLYKTYYLLKQKPFYNDLDPKAVTNDELFGVINQATREWKDGLFSTIMRDMANMPGDGPKWIVLDGDIDPMWIESLNTLMDDNKVLTLASNERIALTKSMRLLFEISNLRTATPATVSRAGILYINPQDLGWNPFVASWIDTTRDDESEKAMLTIMFDKYIPSLLESCKKYKRITPLTDLQQIQLTCYLLECFLNKSLLPSDCPKEWYETYFAFSVVWGFGSGLFQDQLVDWRNEFSKWFCNEFKQIKFPSTGNVFSFFIDPETKKFLPWSEKVESFELDPDLPLQSCLVSTSETTRIRFFMDLLLAKQKPVMLVGSAGSGKTVSVAAKLNSLPESYAITNVPFNFYTTSEMMQKVLEKPLEKKSGRNFGPPGSKFMIYFVDDLNMPEVDTYGTVQPHTLIREFMDYKHWYDRQKLSLKEISNCMFVACMNPTAGSFTIDPRLQRHFCTFAVSFPGIDACFHIYKQILSQHVNNPLNKFGPLVQRYAEPLVNAALTLHNKLASAFLPTAIKFHYIFNLRDLSNIFQGMLFTTGDAIKTQSDLIRLWMHEATRVYSDKMVEEADNEAFQKLISEVIKKNCEDYDENVVFEKPLIYCHFAEGVGDPKYFPIRDWPQVKKLLDESLSSYNDLVATMNLVLFEDAMYHICRINRILEAPRGNALLVGVGGSGKQSLSRLSAFISSLEVFQIQLRKGYSINDLKVDLATLYIKSGLKNLGNVFLMTDAQVADERFLVLINDLLASGEIPELLADDEIENIINGVRGETKASGVPDTRENCWRFFINRVRTMLKVVLCFSPVGATLRIRARKFPSIVNCTAINWFHEWPREALRSVSKRFISEVESLPPDLVDPVSNFMSHVHQSVNQMSAVYFQNERRYNYTTPKTFLEQISLYTKLLNEKTTNLKMMIARLENGLEKLASCAADVAVLKVTLAEQEIILKEKNRAAEALIEVVGAESEKVSKEKAFAAEEEKKVKVIEEDVTIKAKICADDLAKAEPALLAAQEALNTLNKNNLTELKSFGSPPDAVVNVTAAVLVLFSKKGKIPKDRSWKSCKSIMAKVDQFLNDLVFYDKENIHPDVIKAVMPYIKNPEFNAEFIMSKSAAAAGLCAWVINIVKFYDVYVVVEPKRRALNQANAELQAARDKLAFLTDQIKELEEKLEVLLKAFQEAVNEKMKCQAEADATNATIDLANRLVNGLASEKIRWSATVVNLKESGVMLPGDVLLITAFISYVGCFMRGYRQQLMYEDWIPTLQKTNPKIETTEGLDPLSMLTDDAQVACWNNEGLPTDSMSTENATILTNSARWPLMIDPQLQGIKWIKSRYGDSLVVIRLTQRNYLDRIERAVTNGNVVLLENIGETVDAVLEPLLGRVLIRKGKVLKIGDREIDYHPNFRLVIQTKLANPHYQPEMQAQCTLINFTVTRDGLEEQLLGEVVKAERPDLESLRAGLTKQQNDFKITLKTLEDDLLKRLSSAGPDILSDSALVINLEITKKTAADIEIKVEEGKITAVKIDEARERYRRAANRASLLYFILNEIYKINPMYQFSLKAYSVVFRDALARAEPADDLEGRVRNLLDSITFSVFVYTSRGLFERDKLVFLFLITLQVLQGEGKIDPRELDFLLKYAVAPEVSPYSWLSNNSWGGIVALSKMDAFENLDKDIEGATKRWQKYTDGEAPERDKLPGEWKNKTSLQRLCIMRALRPDRMSYASSAFCEENLGTKYVEARTPPIEKSYQESNSTTAMFFILSAGVDPLKDLEKLGRKLGFSTDKKNFHIVSLGQGQEIVAEEAMGVASANGHWVILQNIHLVAKWLATLEKKMEETFENPLPEYRLYLSAEPAADPAYHIIPQGILESAIKITNEPPIGMWANLHKSLDNFNQETLEMCSKEAEFKSVLFALCYFHAVVAERRKFGPQGWNRVYPFNFGDLTICVYVLYNYLEANPRVPWEDLRYLFGEIMYGGHITDDWDRRLCRTFLVEYMQPELVDGELQLAPGFISPPNSDYIGYHQYIDDFLPEETPYLYGLHPNAEIGYLTTVSERLFKVVFEMQPRDSGAQAGGGATKEELVRYMLDDILDRVPEPFNLQELMGKVEELTPYTIVALQECERMNRLMGEIRRSLKELELGLKGELTISNDMEKLMESLFMDNVPDSWTKLAYPSLLGLAAWFSDLCLRLTELENWSGDFNLPPAVWLAGFFNPQSFLTAIMQQTARKNEWPLDKMCLNCDVTKKSRQDFNAPPREGANVHGLYMEGARWDTATGGIVESRMMELFPMMPVIYVKAVTQDKQDTRNVYECPVYKIRMRGPTFVWTFNLKTKDKPTRWTLAGVALLLGV